MTAEALVRTIVFVDIVGSTRLYETLGDKVAQQQVGVLLAQLSRLVEAHYGVVIKTIGDALMCSFENALSAVSACCMMQQHTHSSNGLVQPIKVKIGAHSGDVIVKGQDLFGDTVNQAARFVAAAKSDQILISQSLQSALPRAAIQTRAIGKLKVKGKLRPLLVHEVLWDADTESLTCIAPGPEVGTSVQQTVSYYVCYQQQRVKLDHLVHDVVMGRKSDCDVVVETSTASRLHARLEYRQGKLVLVDQSTNGTYIATSLTDTPVFVHHEEYVLSEPMLMSLGMPVADNPHQLITIELR